MPKDIPYSKKGAASHKSEEPSRYQNRTPGGRPVYPHADRGDDDPLRLRIERMKRKSELSEKIG